MPVIPLVPSDSPTLISSLLRLSAHHLALAASASQPLKSGTLSLYLSVPVSVLIPFVISRPTTVSRPSNPLNPSLLAPQTRLCWPLCSFINYIYLLTYLLRGSLGPPESVYPKWHSIGASVLARLSAIWNCGHIVVYVLSLRSTRFYSWE